MLFVYLVLRGLVNNQINISSCHTPFIKTLGQRYTTYATYKQWKCTRRMMNRSNTMKEHMPNPIQTHISEHVCIVARDVAATRCYHRHIWFVVCVAFGKYVSGIVCVSYVLLQKFIVVFKVRWWEVLQHKECCHYLAEPTTISTSTQKTSQPMCLFKTPNIHTSIQNVSTHIEY